jgi:hypothetical protein
MMANWDKLNKELDTIINNISDEEWEDWYGNIEAQKEMCKMQMILEAKLQSEKIIFNKLLGKLIINETLRSDTIVDLSNISITQNFLENISTTSKNITNYPLAA